jgi:hypothetical protein
MASDGWGVLTFIVEEWNGVEWHAVAGFWRKWDAEQFIAAVSDDLNHYRIKGPTADSVDADDWKSATWDENAQAYR